jgi:hypothetical protein
MLHQTLIVGIAYVLVPLHLGPVAEPMLVLVGTIGGCALLHEGVIRRVHWLRPLFGVKLPRRKPAVDKWSDTRFPASDTQ